jgi:hypothetical protein
MRTTWTIAIALLASACAQDLTIHVRGGDRPPNPEFLVVDGGVTVDRLQLVLRNIRLQSVPTDGGFDTPDVRVIGPGPYYVDLAPEQLSGGTFTQIGSGVHIGAKGFYEMDIDLAPVTDADVAAVPSLTPLLGKTFIITGHNAQGAPFSFDSPLQEVLTRQSVYRMGMNHNNVDVNIAPNVWFVSPDGAPLDPVSNAPAVRTQIETNFATSIDGYEDDDLNGHPDPLG